ncbi:hypothetical protein V3565_04480 [Bartonella sp. B10]
MEFFSIADIDDPKCIRVVLYSNGRMGHAPLSALLHEIHQKIGILDKKQVKTAAQIVQRVNVLEQQLQLVVQNLQNIKH